MQVKLEQVFYGRGQFGYGVLGASPNGKAFGSAVESLCESIGSPDAFLARKPFLVNKCFGDYCLMCCVQPGEPDSCGRPTILYHVLIGLASEMVAAGLDAFALQDDGLFRSVVVEYPESVSVEGRSQRHSSDVPFKVRLPAAVSVHGPDPDLINGLLGADAVRRSWATFAFHPMPGFDLYALNDRASLPTDVTCYDSNGKLLSAVKITDQEGRRPMPISKKSPLLRVSLVVNAALLVACVFLFSRHPSPRPQEDRAQVVADETFQHQVDDLKKTNDRVAETNALLEAEVNRLRNEIEQKSNSVAGVVSRDEVIRELREKFKSEYRGETIDKERMSDILNALGKSETGKIVPPYIRFVNETIFRLSSTKQE